MRVVDLRNMYMLKDILYLHGIHMWHYIQLRNARGFFIFFNNLGADALSAWNQQLIADDILYASFYFSSLKGDENEMRDKSLKIIQVIFFIISMYKWMQVFSYRFLCEMTNVNVISYSCF